MSLILRLALTVILLVALAAPGHAMSAPGAPAEAAGMHPAPDPSSHPPASGFSAECRWLCTVEIPVLPGLPRQPTAHVLPIALAAGEGLLLSGIAPENPDPPPRAATV